MDNQISELNVFVQGPSGEDSFQAKDTASCWISEKYGALGKRLMVHRADGKLDLFAFAVDGPPQYKQYNVSFEWGVLKVLNSDGTLHTAYAPGLWVSVDGNGLKV